MTFPIVLLIAGIVLLLLGLLGKIQLQQFGAESSNTLVRVLVSIIGVALMGVSYVVYMNDKPPTLPPPDNSSTNLSRTSASPVGAMTSTSQGVTSTPIDSQSPSSSPAATRRSDGCDQGFPGIDKKPIAIGLGQVNLFNREQSKDKLVGITLSDRKNQSIGAITFTTKFTPNPSTSRDDVVFTDVALYDSTCKRTDEYENETKHENKPDVHNDDQVVLTLTGKQYWLILEYNYGDKYINAHLLDKKIRG